MIEKFKEVIVNNKPKTIILLFLIIFSIIIIIINKNNDNKNKNFNNQKYIYTSETTEINGITSKLPYINIKGDDIDIINKNIATKYYTEEMLGERYINYEYYINKNIVSLLVIYQYIESESILSEEIDFYNINIRNGKILSNDEMFNLYNIDKNYVKEKVLDSVKEYYDYEVEKNYINDCDLNCFENRISNNLLEEINYYVKDNNLYAYLSFKVEHDLVYDDKAPFELFRFKIK